MLELAQPLPAKKPVAATPVPNKLHIVMWLAFFLVVYLSTVLARVEYRIHVQAQQNELALSQAQPKLIDYVKSTMFKPASFELKSIRCNPPNDVTPYYEFGMHYFASNILNEAVPNYIEVLADVDGNIVKVVRE